ncbi:endo-1,4-beta-xylanase [Beutenbergia cavernae]|uniref:endo-1,4-beta-xylanase n=1 Tax=Beutenbergia cavernae TaxID=84757 RepID=UPI001FE1F5A9|nr:endo-1,4-beta-xylanase [Beutenbergia cavernae]
MTGTASLGNAVGAPPPEPAAPAQAVVTSDFEDGTTQGWSGRGSASVAVTADAAHDGAASLLVTGRTQAWNGASLDVTSAFEAGTTYGVDLWLRLATGAEPTDLRVSVQRDAGGSSIFDTVATVSATADAWVQVAAEYTMPAAAEATQLYVESTGSLTDFLLDGVVVTGEEVPPVQEDIPPLRDVLAGDFGIGVAIDARETTGASAQLLTRHFGQITAENAMKPESIQPTEGEFTFEAADALVAFAQQNDLRVYGHTLVWHSQTPEWFFARADGTPLTSSPEDQAILLGRMEAHITAMGERFGDAAWAWDVVNEAIDESQPDGLRRSRWYEVLGPDYLTHAFRFADAAFPDAQLFLNDYNTEFPAKREAMYRVVADLIADGVPIDGVGHQLHVNLTRPVAQVDATLARFAELGVAQAVTELDVSISRSADESLPTTPPERLVEQGYYYRDLFEVLRAHELASVTLWGLHDGRSWLRTWPIERPHEAPLAFDDRLQAKPAYWGIVDPGQLPHLPRAARVPAAAVELGPDAPTDPEWSLVPLTEVGASEAGTSTFGGRWDASRLTVLVRVADATPEGDDAVELFADGPVPYRVARDGTTTGEGSGAVVIERPDGTGYDVVAALPLTAAEPGASVPFDLRLTDASVGQVSWSDLSHTQETRPERRGALELSEEVPVVDVPLARVVPVVDGVVEAAWDGAVVVATGVQVEGTPGASADVRLLWSDGALHALAEVTDPEIDTSNSNAWEQDSVEIFLDPGNTKAGAYDPDDGQYRVSATGHVSISGDLEVIGDNLTSAATLTPTGYVVEASLVLDGAATSVLAGLELQVNDATDGARSSVRTWADPTGLSYQNTSRWGVARLAGRAVPACTSTVTDDVRGPLVISDGVTCLDGAEVRGPVLVRTGASLVARTAEIRGPLAVSRAGVVHLEDVRVSGPIAVSGAEVLRLDRADVRGPVGITGVSHLAIVSGSTIAGPLACWGNAATPTDDGVANVVRGPTFGQCAGF